MFPVFKFKYQKGQASTKKLQTTKINEITPRVLSVVSILWHSIYVSAKKPN